MKKTLLLTMALGLASVASLSAQSTVDVYLTGSTAFRTYAYESAKKLYATAPTIYYGDAASGGAASGFSSSFTCPSCAARGQKNVPCSSRLVISHIPVPSQ